MELKTKRTAKRKPIPFDEVVKRLLDTPPARVPVKRLSKKRQSPR